MPYLSLEEEIAAMTLQVAMIGSDGFLIVSDKKDYAPDAALRNRKVKKIFINHEQGTVLAVAGYSKTTDIARELINQRYNPRERCDTEDLLKRCGKESYDSVHENRNINGQLIFFEMKEPKRFWNVLIQERVYAQEYQDRWVASGDNKNLSLNFLETFFDVKKPISEQVFLAALCIYYGSKNNSGSISEEIDAVVVLNKGGTVHVHEMPPQELSQLVGSCKDFHHELSEAIQRYCYESRLNL